MPEVKKEEVEAALDRIRPALQADGGDIEVVDITEDGVVKVHLMGACHGCPSATMTLQMGVERVLKDLVPGVEGIEAV
jgi:Fe-S cluster biogenesis protein NfuA